MSVAGVIGIAGEDPTPGGDGALGERVGARLEQAASVGTATLPVGPGRDQAFLQRNANDRGHQLFLAWALPLSVASGLSVAPGLSATSMQKSGQIW